MQARDAVALDFHHWPGRRAFLEAGDGFQPIRKRLAAGPTTGHFVQKLELLVSGIARHR